MSFFMKGIFRCAINANINVNKNYSHNQNILSSFKDMFKRRYHFNSSFKRPKLDKKKWNTYDELKLFSYSSHLAFFMLLPPILQMYTTKVEVFRDDTLHESEFESVNINNGITMKNIQILDTINEIKHELMGLYINNTGNNKSSTNDITNSNKLPVIKKDSKTYELKVVSKEEQNEDNEFILKLNDAFNSIKKNNINKFEYINRLESITDELISFNSKDKKADKNEYFNNTIMKMFEQINQLKMYDISNNMFKYLLTSSFEDTNRLKFMNIRGKIVNNYEYSKKRKNNRKYKKEQSNTIIQTNKLIKISPWLRSYINSVDRFTQMVHLFAQTNQSHKSFVALFGISKRNVQLSKQIEKADIKYQLSSDLKAMQKEREAVLLEKMYM